MIFTWGIHVILGHFTTVTIGLGVKSPLEKVMGVESPWRSCLEKVIGAESPWRNPKCHMCTNIVVPVHAPMCFTWRIFVSGTYYTGMHVSSMYEKREAY